MATPPPPTQNQFLPSTGGNVKLDLQRVSPTECVVTLPNGEEYLFSVFKTGHGSDQDITSRNWTQVAQHVANVFYQSIQGQSFETAEITLKGDIDHINSQTGQANNVVIDKAEVSYKDRPDARELKVKTYSETPGDSPLPFNQVSTLAQKFIQDVPRPISSQDSTTSSPTTRNQFEEIEIDPRLEVCAARPHPVVANTVSNQPFAPFALADQITHLQAGKTVYAASSDPQQVTTIATSVNREVALHIDGIIVREVGNFEIKRAILRQAKESDPSLYQSTLAVVKGKKGLFDRGGQTSSEMMDKFLLQTHVCNPEETFKVNEFYERYYQSKKNQWINNHLANMSDSLQRGLSDDRPTLTIALGVVANDMNRLSAVLNQSSKSEEDKQWIAEVYLRYISQTNCKFVGSTFFESFVELHRLSRHHDFFQIVVIEEENGQKRAQSYPQGEQQLDPARCAFLHFNKVTGVYSSYDRKAKDCVDLNQSRQLISNKAVKQRQIRTPRKNLERTDPKVDTIELSSAGNCLDASVAFGILQHSLSNNRGTFSSTDSLEEKRLKANHYGNELRNKVHTHLTTKKAAVQSDSYLMDCLITAIQEIPEKPSQISSLAHGRGIDRSQLSDQEKGSLIDYYASYVQSTASKSKTHLDYVFLYLLSKELPSNAPKIVVIQGDKIAAILPKTPGALLSFKNAVFVNYDGMGHYQAVSRTSKSAQEITRMNIAEFLNTLIEEPIQIISLKNNQMVYMEQGLRDVMQKKRNILARLIVEYQSLITAASKTNRSTSPPKDLDTRINDAIAKIDDLSTIKLQLLLKEIKQNMDQNPTAYAFTIKKIAKYLHESGD